MEAQVGFKPTVSRLQVEGISRYATEPYGGFKPPSKVCYTITYWQGILDSNQEAQLSVGFTEIKI